MTTTKTYEVRTHGCQMNVHDSERLAGLLEAAGYLDLASVPADSRPDTADVVVFNTCAVRENADNRLYGNLGQLRSAKLRNPAMQIAVGGCLAQKDRATIVDRAPWVDVVFGTHNIGSLPALLDRARHNGAAAVEILDSLETFPSTLPTRRERAYSGWVSISVGCNNTCTFCIVPSLRGTEADRSPEDVLAEVRALVARRRHRDHAARAERQHLRRAVRRPAGLRQAAARLWGDRRAGAGPVHQPTSRCIHSRRHRRHGRDPERHAQPAHAAAVRVGRRPACDAPLLPQSAVPEHCREVRRAHPRRRHHDRHHRRLPRRDRGRLPRHPRCRCGGSLRERVHVPVLAPPWHASRHHGGAGAQGGGARAIRAARRSSRGDLVGGEPGSRRPRGRGSRRPAGRPQGRRDPAPLGPGAGQPARALHAPPRHTGARRAAPRRPGHRRGHLRRAAPPRRRLRAARRAVLGAPNRRRRRLVGRASARTQAARLGPLGMPSRGRPRAPAALPGRC